MKLYFAPLEGITDGTYIAAHRAQFSGVSKYFTPFISVSEWFNLSKKEDSLISFAAVVVDFSVQMNLQVHSAIPIPAPCSCWAGSLLP